MWHILCMPIIAFPANMIDHGPPIPRPRVDVRNMIAQPIFDQTDPIFTIQGLEIIPPNVDSLTVPTLDIEVSVRSSTIKDETNGETYTVYVKSQPVIRTFFQYTFVLGVAGRMPLQRGKVKGSVEVQINARAEHNGRSSYTRVLKSVSVSN